AFPADAGAHRRNQGAGGVGREDFPGVRGGREGRGGRNRRQGPEGPLRQVETQEEAAMSWPYPRIVAHRGGGALAPENTLGAIRLGASMGFKGVEFDVMLTADAMP